MTPLKVVQAVEAIKAAEKAVGEIVGMMSLYISSERKISVHVRADRDLEQIPGELQHKNFGYEDFPLQAFKVFDGIEFYRLLTPEEARAITE